MFSGASKSLNDIAILKIGKAVEDKIKIDSVTELGYFRNISVKLREQMCKEDSKCIGEARLLV